MPCNSVNLNLLKVRQKVGDDPDKRQVGTNVVNVFNTCMIGHIAEQS